MARREVGKVKSEPEGLPPWAQIDGADLLVRVKAVPGARRSEIAGVLGDRLKIRVSAPPEGGRANAAIAELLAEACGLEGRLVELEQGAAQARKLFRISRNGRAGVQALHDAAEGRNSQREAP